MPTYMYTYTITQLCNRHDKNVQYLFTFISIQKNEMRIMLRPVYLYVPSFSETYRFALNEMHVRTKILWHMYVCASLLILG